jgi:hypothetical protein
MTSSYTSNTGIEKPATGDQSGTWGDTVNVNMDIIDRVLNGVGAISLSGTTHTLTTSDGSLSDGMYRVLVLGGSPSGTNTITVSPNDQDKVFFVKNGTGQSVVFTQGSGANVTIASGDTKIIYCDGAGAGAAVVDFTNDLSMSSVSITGGTIDNAAIGGSTPAAAAVTTLTASGVTTVQAGTALLPSIVPTGDTNTGVWFPAADTVAASTAGSERMRIDSSGNVGIGTDSPSDKLEVVGILNANGTTITDTQIEINEGGSGDRYAFLDFHGDDTYTDYGLRIIRNNDGANANSQIEHRGTGALAIISTDAGHIPLLTSNTERMRIDSVGNVGIGTSSPATTLDVGTGNIRSQSLQGGYGNAVGNYHIDSKIGTAGATYVNWISGTGGLRVGNGAGNYGAAYASAFTVSSDRRLKENISYFDSGLAQILQLKPATFDFINGENNQKGFIAQDVETIIPEVVGRATMPDLSGEVDETDEYLTLNQSAIIPYMVSAIKEQQTMILALTDRITELEG